MKKKFFRDDVYHSFRRAIKKRDLLYKVICSGLIQLNYSNIELQALEIRNKKYHSLKRKYANEIDVSKYTFANSKSVRVNKVWICWFQGIDNAPSIVKKCIKSIYKYFNGFEINIIDDNNLENFICLPDWIKEKRRKGIIPPAHFSDIIRTELLLKYGGIWIDATTYFTSPLPPIYLSKPLFMLQFDSKEDLTIKVNSWLIYAEPNNRILNIVRDLIYIYWKKENYLSEYFLWHMLVTIAFDFFPEDYTNMYYISERNSYYLYNQLFDYFDEQYWNYIKNNSPYHKLSYYKFNTTDGEMPDNYKGTYYEYIMQDEQMQSLDNTRVMI